MTIIIKILKRDEESRVALNTIFDPENIQACENYGTGDHCNSDRVAMKIELWGKRGEDDKNPLKCHLIFKDGDPTAMLNIGVPGNPPTVIDRRESSEGKVLEMSGVMVRDMYLADPEMGNAISSVLAQYQAPGFRKAFLTFKVGHIQQAMLAEAGAKELSADNLTQELGDNPIHPERFKVEDKKLLECTKWDSSVEKVSHDGWHDSYPCVDWVEKTAMVFEIGESGYIQSDL